MPPDTHSASPTSPTSPAPAADPLLTRTPTTLWPENLDRLPEDYRADPIVSVVRESLSVAQAAWRATLIGHEKIMRDPMQTEASNLARSAKAAAKRQDEALGGLDRAAERVKREISMIDEALAKPLDPPAPHVVTLIATRLASMSPDQRSKLLGEAMRTRDEATLGATLFIGPAWVYGLSDAERAVHLVQYQQDRYGPALARRDALQQALEIASGAGRSYIVAAGRLIDRKRLEDAQALADEAKAAGG